METDIFNEINKKISTSIDSVYRKEYKETNDKEEIRKIDNIITHKILEHGFAISIHAIDLIKRRGGNTDTMVKVFIKSMQDRLEVKE